MISPLWFHVEIQPFKSTNVFTDDEETRTHYWSEPCVRNAVSFFPHESLSAYSPNSAPLGLMRSVVTIMSGSNRPHIGVGGCDHILQPLGNQYIYRLKWEFPLY